MKKTTLGSIVVKLLKTSAKRKIVKGAKGGGETWCLPRNKVMWKADCPSKQHAEEGSGGTSFKFWKEENSQPGILYPAIVPLMETTFPGFRQRRQRIADISVVQNVNRVSFGETEMFTEKSVRGRQGPSPRKRGYRRT